MHRFRGCPDALLGLAAFNVWPARLVPFNLGDEEGAAVAVATAFHVAMVEDVLLLVLAFENLAAVAGAIETVALVAVQYGGGVSLLHGAAFSVDKSVGQLLCSAHLKLVSVVGIKAGTHEEIPVFAVLVQVGSLEYLGAVGVLLNLQACRIPWSGWGSAQPSGLPHARMLHLPSGKVRPCSTQCGVCPRRNRRRATLCPSWGR